MKRIFYMGAPSHVKLGQNASVADALKATGSNTGNLLIGHAIKRHLKADIISSDRSLGNDYISKNFDYIVIGASNFLFHKFDFGSWASFLEAVKLPCVIIGLGAQASSYGSKVEVHEGTKRMIQIISERSSFLGVRGYFTASTLIDMGIKNVKVIGCPSMYWTCRPEIELKEHAPNRPLAVALNGSANVVQHSVDIEAAKKLEAQIIRFALDNDRPYILQNEDMMMEIAAGTPAGNDTKVIRSLMSRYGLSDITSERFVDFVKRNTKVFFDVAEWHAAVKAYDLVIGSRFHGCLIALLAGVPCFTFIHDTRTREMCELLGIPHIAVNQVDQVDIGSLYNSIDRNTVKIAYRYLYQNYVDFLEQNGLDHSLSR